MAKFMNTFTWNQAPNDEFYSLVTATQENARKLMAEGKLLHLFYQQKEKSGGWAVQSHGTLVQHVETIQCSLCA